MTKKEITQLSFEIIGCAIKVHKALGPGLMESIYEKCLRYELEKNGFKVSQQFLIPIIYDEMEMDIDLRLDLLIEDSIVVEVKAITNILPVHEAQILTYMKLVNAPQGILINFYTDNITKSAKYFVNDFFRIYQRSKWKIHA
ncbi:GxxExxY protein [Pedobacter chinensis]|uniref:GxxExxY protein n=1 Tax=Pedobacter chinensis TaxID=2282421 RepID=A0A369PWV1_9SPHI|nr:GxxExxY protein [Pedobacter chinensis]RDC57171.1 GxxExxY protein [Pedobacter chinensis]